jgi:hypothetical protein
MKAFFGALMLALVSAVVGLITAAQLHGMAIAAGGAGASMTPTSMEVIPEQQNRPIKQSVKYTSPKAAQNAQPGAADI